MPGAEEVSVTHIFHGDDLDPQTISDQLRLQPTKITCKEARRVWTTGRETVAGTNQWQLRAKSDSSQENLEPQVCRLFNESTADEDVWRNLSARFGGALFVGLFLNKENERVAISAQTLNAIAARGLNLEFDIYEPTED